MNETEEIKLPKLIITLRGKKYDNLQWNTSTKVSDVKSYLSTCVKRQEATASDVSLEPSDMKLIHKGKILSDDSTNIYDAVLHNHGNGGASAKPIRLMAVGMSAREAEKNSDALHHAKRNAPRIRDDLSDSGKAELAARQRLGRKMLQKASSKDSQLSCHSSKYGFGRIETLPMLPDSKKAKDMLQSLANDPGILACMAKHKWHVGCLAELFPEGKVGESQVCVMGLNQNKGQKILLRLRTDDLKGFRKVLSIRKVLFHELAHNVHSEHDGKFFQLMRQVEKDCNELNWMRDGHRSGGLTSGSMVMDSGDDHGTYAGGTYVLGADATSPLQQRGIPMSKRDLAAKAAITRLSEEEKAIQEACGCFQNQPVHSESRTTSLVVNEDDDSV